jgi:16S rRNA (cytidine1402-2'-O)-methyltransferase
MAKALLFTVIYQSKRREESSFKSLERISFEKNQSQIFIETPYRNKLLEDLIQTLKKPIYASTDITLPTEYIKTNSCLEKETIDLHKRPTIFIIHKM